MHRMSSKLSSLYALTIRSALLPKSLIESSNSNTFLPLNAICQWVTLSSSTKSRKFLVHGIISLAAFLILKKGNIRNFRNSATYFLNSDSESTTRCLRSGSGDAANPSYIWGRRVYALTGFQAIRMFKFWEKTDTQDTYLVILQIRD